MKYFSFLNTDPFQLSLWFLLSNDNDMASAVGKRCSIPVYKREIEMERAQMEQEMALGNCVLWLVFGCLCALMFSIILVVLLTLYIYVYLTLLKMK